MKIAYFTNCYPKASHSFIRREIGALESLGVEIQRVSIRRPRDLVDPADLSEARKTWVLFDHLLLSVLMAAGWSARHPVRAMRTVQLTARMGYRGGRIFKHLLYAVEALALARLFSSQGIGHVHAHFGTNPAAVAMLCHVAGGPGYSITVHGPTEFDEPKQLALTEKISRADFVVAISQFGKSQLLRWADPADWSKIHVIHCGVDEDFLSREPTSIPPSSRLVCVGRLCRQKGQLLLVEAAAQLKKQGLDPEIVLVGDGAMRGQLESRIRAFGVDENVRITGWQSNQQVRAHLQNARAMVLPSFAEGLPVVIMESLAMGRPVISTWIAGIPELVRNGESGWLIAPGDIDALVDAMGQALTATPEKLERMAAIGRCAVSTNHNCHTEAMRLLSLFSKMPCQTSGQTTYAVTEPSITQLASATARGADRL